MLRSSVPGRFLVPALAAGLLAACGAGSDSPTTEAVGTQLARLEHRVQLLEDSKAIKRLQRTYGYYVDKGMGDRIGELFSDRPDGSVEIAGSGVYVGKSRISEFYRDPAGPLSEGELFNHMILPGVVHLVALDRRLTRLEDMDAIERLNAVYGYYLARNQWADLAGIFAPEGSIEIALRGVYIGSESVRRNLDLYGEPGIHHGLLHNHMQYQPVIHVAEEGQTAEMRSRAFSIMGQFGAYAQWMGGVYENDFIKQDGIWKVQRDQVFNTYFVPYATGWRDASLRPPPGINPANPPDAPPSTQFETYPRAFLPPFHYEHAVLREETPTS